MFKRFSAFAAVLLFALSGTIRGAQDKESGTKTAAATAASVLAEQGTRQRIRPSRAIALPVLPQNQSIRRPKEVRGNEADVVPKSRIIKKRDQLIKPPASVDRNLADPAGKSRDLLERRQTLIIRLEHTTATEVAETIGDWSAAEEDATNQPAVSVVVMDSRNRLLVTGVEKQLMAVQGIVRELDQPATLVRVRMAVVELTLEGEPPAARERVSSYSSSDIEKTISELKEKGNLRTVARAELLASDSLPAFVQLGVRVPTITGSAVSARGQTNSVTRENVGTILGVTARAVENQIVTLELDLEHSHIGPKDEGTPIASSDTGVVIRSSEISSLTVQTTASVPTGKTVVLAGMVQKYDRLWRKTLVLLQPEIVR